MKTVFFLALVLVGTTFSSCRELQFENEFVRVWKTTIIPNGTLKYHRHDNNRIVVGLKGGTLKKIEDTGEVSYLDFETEKAYWLEQDPMGILYVDVNEGYEDVVVMVIELKSFDAPGHGFGIDFVNYGEETDQID